MACIEMLEGTWEELAARAEEFKGRRLRLIVLPEGANALATTPDESRIGGWPLQRNLWAYIEERVLQIHLSNAVEQPRMRQLMEQYHDTPMDLADASLVATAETLNLTRIFTMDSDFYVYRINHIGVCEVVF